MVKMSTPNKNTGLKMPAMPGKHEHMQRITERVVRQRSRREQSRRKTK
jgi:hypothetical protein